MAGSRSRRVRTPAGIAATRSTKRAVVHGGVRDSKLDARVLRATRPDATRGPHSDNGSRA
jgi:hypothetical protein